MRRRRSFVTTVHEWGDLDGMCLWKEIVAGPASASPSAGTSLGLCAQQRGDR